MCDKRSKKHFNSPKVLVVGCGSIGKRHLNNLLQLGVMDLMLLRSKPDQLEEHPKLPVYTELGIALSHEPDVVIISNPTGYHLDVAIPAAKAGCHLFIEKPLSNSLDGVDELFFVAKQKNLLVAMGFDLRFDPGLRKIKELLDQEFIGKIVSIQAQVGQYLPDWHPWEDYRFSGSASIHKGGGVIFDLIHELDYVSWLGGSVLRVSCFSGRVSKLEIETEDVAAILLGFQNGAIGTVNLDYIQRVPSRTCRIIGEKGTIVWNYFANEVAWYQVDVARWEKFEYLNFQRNDRFLAEMQSFLNCLQTNEKPHVTLVEGIEVLKLALSAKRSAFTGEHLFLDGSSPVKE